VSPKSKVNAIRRAYFFLGEAGANAHDIYHVALHHPNIGQMTPAECVKILSFAFTLLFLLNQTPLTTNYRVLPNQYQPKKQQNHALFFVDRFKLTNFVGVLPPAGRALIVKVSSNVIPAKSANLWRDVVVRR
jgi:hypothetical protein